MQKIISLFQRNYDTDRLVRDQVTPGAEWVPVGEGIATRKFDGTCCLVRGAKLYKRFELRLGAITPPNFEPAGEVDSVTGKQQGWLPVNLCPEDRWHREAFAMAVTYGIEDGTYELCGPKINGNPERCGSHTLLVHGKFPLPDAPRDFEELRKYMATCGYEGIVWHHTDGRMVKLKVRDFGFRRLQV